MGKERRAERMRKVKAGEWENGGNWRTEGERVLDF